MDNFVELILRGTALQILEVEDLDTDESYIAVPFGFRSLPLIVASLAEGKRVVCKDAWVNQRMHHYPSRPPRYPENVATAQLVSVTLETKDHPQGITKVFSGEGLERLPRLHEFDDGTRWEKVQGIEVAYKVRHAAGRELVETLHPDYFIFEDDRGEYNLFYQETHQTKTAVVISSAAEAFVRPHSDFDEFDFTDHGELGQDCQIAQIEVNAAMARGDMREAVRVSAMQFGVPVTYVNDILEAS